MTLSRRYHLLWLQIHSLLARNTKHSLESPAATLRLQNKNKNWNSVLIKTSDCAGLPLPYLVVLLNNILQRRSKDLMRLHYFCLISVLPFRVTCCHSFFLPITHNMIYRVTYYLDSYIVIYIYFLHYWYNLLPSKIVNGFILSKLPISPLLIKCEIYSKYM